MTRQIYQTQQSINMQLQQQQTCMQQIVAFLQNLTQKEPTVHEVEEDEPQEEEDVEEEPMAMPNIQGDDPTADLSVQQLQEIQEELDQAEEIVKQEQPLTEAYAVFEKFFVKEFLKAG